MGANAWLVLVIAALIGVVGFCLGWNYGWSRGREEGWDAGYRAGVRVKRAAARAEESLATLGLKVGLEPDTLYRGHVNGQPFEARTGVDEREALISEVTTELANRVGVQRLSVDLVRGIVNEWERRRSVVSTPEVRALIEEARTWANSIAPEERLKGEWYALRLADALEASAVSAPPTITEEVVEAAMREHDYSLDRDTTRALIAAALRAALGGKGVSAPGEWPDTAAGILRVLRERQGRTLHEVAEEEL